MTNVSCGKDICASKTKLNDLANQRQNNSFIVETHRETLNSFSFYYNFLRLTSHISAFQILAL